MRGKGKGSKRRQLEELLRLMPEAHGVDHGRDRRGYCYSIIPPARSHPPQATFDLRAACHAHWFDYRPLYHDDDVGFLAAVRYEQFVSSLKRSVPRQRRPRYRHEHLGWCPLAGVKLTGMQPQLGEVA